MVYSFKWPLSSWFALRNPSYQSLSLTSNTKGHKDNEKINISGWLHEISKHMKIRNDSQGETQNLFFKKTFVARGVEIIINMQASFFLLQTKC